MEGRAEGRKGCRQRGQHGAGTVRASKGAQWQRRHREGLAQRAGKPLQGGSQEETRITSPDALVSPDHLYRVQVCKALGAEPAHRTPHNTSPRQLLYQG